MFPRSIVLLLLLVGSVQAETFTVMTTATGDSSAPFAFEPASLTIEEGDTVRWINDDGAFHTTTSQDGIWDGTLGSKGTTFEYTFETEGTYAYRCNPHASFMTGSIIVEPGPERQSTPAEDAPSVALPLVFAALAVLAWARR